MSTLETTVAELGAALAAKLGVASLNLPDSLAAVRLTQCYLALEEAHGNQPARIQAWMQAPHPAFEGRTPASVLGSGEGLDALCGVLLRG